MSATDELRKMLDERGVEWGNVRNDGSKSDYLTEWQLNDRQGYAIALEWAVDGGMSVDLHRHDLTPEQAIAATLGVGTCHINELDALTQTLSMANACAWGECSECGYLTPDDSTYCINCGRKVEG